MPVYQRAHFAGDFLMCAQILYLFLNFVSGGPREVRKIESATCSFHHAIAAAAHFARSVEAGKKHGLLQSLTLLGYF